MREPENRRRTLVLERADDTLFVRGRETGERRSRVPPLPLRKWEVAREASGFY